MDRQTRDDATMVNMTMKVIQQVLDVEGYNRLPTPWILMEIILWVVAALVALSSMCTLAVKKRSKNESVNWPVVGMLPGLIARLHNYYEWTTDVLIETGGNCQFWGPWFANMDSFVTTDPRALEHVLRLKMSNYPKGPDYSAIFHELLGNGIFNVDDELWRLQRKAASLQLHSQECKSYTNASIITSVESKLLPVLHHLCDDGKAIDVQDLMLRFTFDTFCMVGFGVDTGYLARDLPSVPFATAFETALECATHRFLLPASCWRVLRLLRLGKERDLPSSISVIDRFIDDVISRRRSELLQQTASESDLLSCFMKLAGDTHDDKFLRDMSINFLLAGRDTSALALSWFFWLVATHPRVEEKLVQEARQVIDSSTRSGGAPITPDDLSRMTYLHAALSESLRLYPSVPTEVKYVKEDDTLPDGTRVKKKQRLIYNIYAMGRMESIWGPDCRSFRPERWLADGSAASSIRNVSPFQFAAFNAGPRTCLGKDMAYVLMKAVASSLLYHFRLNLVPGHKVVPKLSITLYMKHGLLLTLEPRNPPSRPAIRL